jgi:hypothetical protein
MVDRFLRLSFEKEASSFLKKRSKRLFLSKKAFGCSVRDEDEFNGLKRVSTYRRAARRATIAVQR